MKPAAPGATGGGALAIAMRLFWRRGFAETAISYLTEAMGIGKKSLYAAFGSKEEAFAERKAQATAAALLLSGSVLRPLSWEGNAPPFRPLRSERPHPESGLSELAAK